MPTYDVSVDFVFTTTVRVDAPDEASIPALLESLTHDQLAHLNGKSYADVDETSRRDVVSIVEVI